jgi:hypothetical protein
VIRPDHRVWAIILTPPFKSIDLKKMERRSLSLGLGLRYDIFVRPRHQYHRPTHHKASCSHYDSMK